MDCMPASEQESPDRYKEFSIDDTEFLLRMLTDEIVNLFQHDPARMKYRIKNLKFKI